MTVSTFTNFVSRRTAGGHDESGDQFWNIIIVEVTGAHDAADGRRWIAGEKVVATATVLGEELSMERGLAMRASHLEAAISA
jgi:hypothetical protein